MTTNLTIDFFKPSSKILMIYSTPLPTPTLMNDIEFIETVMTGTGINLTIRHTITIVHRTSIGERSLNNILLNNPSFLGSLIL